jgi:gliding motility-associated-like protein
MRIKFLFLLLLLFSIKTRLKAQNNVHVFTECATSQLMNRDIDLQNKQDVLNFNAYSFFTSKHFNKTTSLIATVPVVVHIIHTGGPENISNAQVQTAINNINAKFLMSNNYQIQLCLAQRDPAGNPTNGITRDSSSLTTETMETDDISLKNINRWAPTCYLNIWIVRDINSISMGSGVIGYAYMPAAHGLNMDGIVIEAGYFGSSSINDCVGTHELGHYFGLYHTFENSCTNNNCLTDGDMVCDTPPDQTTFSACVPSANSCNTDANDPSTNNPFTTDVADLSDDYMDYSSLSCYSQFTAGQYTRMQFYLTNVRYSLLNCLSCSSPCPASVTATITSPVSTTIISTGTVISFSGAVVNSTSYQWYIVPSTILSTATTASYTFSTAGTYWMKFRAISGNPSLCLDGLDSVKIIVIQPAVSSCAGSLFFNHTNDAIDLPPPSGTQFYSSNGFTWECWVKLTTPFSSYSSSLLRPIISAIDNTVYEDMCLSFGWTGGVGNVAMNHLCFKIDGPNSSTGPCAVSCDYIPSGGFLLNTWYHVAATMDYTSHTAKLYLNGNLVDTKTVNSAPIIRTIPTELSWDVTRTPGYPNLPLGGYMDEVRIWSRVRTPAEISTNYNQCMAGSETNLMLYYRCNQSAGSIATDASPNLYNGSLINLTAWSNQQPTLVGSNCFIGCSNPCPPIYAGKDTLVCLGNPIQLNATSGFTSYTWTPAAGLNNANINNPVASPTISTTYVVTGTTLDSSMQICTSSDTIKVKVISASIPTLNLGPDIFLCTSGTHVFHAPAGFYNYVWNDGSANQNYTAYGPGKYWVTVRDSCGGVHSDTVNVISTIAPSLNLMQDTLICIGDGISLRFNPPGVFTTFQWAPVYGLSCTHCSNPVATPSLTTQYYLIATTADGCSTTDSVLITINPNKPAFVHENIVDATCSLSNGIVIVDSVSGGTPGYQYSFNNSTFSSNTIYNNVAAGTYSLSVKDSLGCILKSSVVIINHAGPTGITISTSNTSVCESNGEVLLGPANGGTPPYLYSFDQGPYLNVIDFNMLAAGVYTVSIKDSNNCIYTGTFTIKEIPAEEETIIPNCFTPNGDQINETWFVTGKCIKSFACKIYDRWGVLMATLNSINENWDGRYKGNPVADGVYYYVLDISYSSGKAEHYNGPINLIR